MMFRIYHNGALFYDDASPLESMRLIYAKVNIAVGEAGSLEFTVPPTNVAYDSFGKMTSYIDVYRNSDLIFSGRVLDETKTYDGMSKVLCEGLLAVFNDSCFVPQVYASITLSDLVQAMLNSHNSQVGVDKQIQLGTITVTDDYVYRAYEEYKLTIERLKDLVDSYGGYMSIRKENGTLYLDWIKEFEDVAEQSIDFGVNLIDLMQESSADELVTVLLPLGAEIEDSEGNRSKLTVASVNDGNIYIENTEGIAEFGRIVGIKQWDDITIPANLFAKGTEYLNDMRRSRVTINAKAVDMAKVGSSIEAFTVGQRIKVSAELFGVDDYFLAMSQSLDLMNPANNQMTLGNKLVGYVGKTRQEQNQINKTVNVINNNYASGTLVNNKISDLDSSTSQSINALIDEVTTIDSRIDEVNGAVTDAIETSKTYADGQIEKISSEFIRSDSDIIMRFTDTADNIDNAFKFSQDGTFTIRNSNSRIYSRQGAEFYEFVDGSTDTKVFRISEDGTTGLQANVTGQVGIGAGSVDAYVEQWAIRKGGYDSVVGGYDLQIVWIGG